MKPNTRKNKQRKKPVNKWIKKFINNVKFVYETNSGIFKIKSKVDIQFFLVSVYCVRIWKESFSGLFIRNGDLTISFLIYPL